MAAGADELVPDSGGLTEHSKRWWNGHVKWDRNGYIDEKDGGELLNPMASNMAF